MSYWLNIPGSGSPVTNTQIVIPADHAPDELDAMLGSALDYIFSIRGSDRGPDSRDTPTILGAHNICVNDDPPAILGVPNITDSHAQASADMVLMLIKNMTETDNAVALAHGFVPYRDLWQMRCQLPAPEPSNLSTRPFTESDIDEFVTVNNRAFHWHPEQGSITTDTVKAKMAQPWFDANGFLLHHRNGLLASFCWTKIHPCISPTSPSLGELYVMAVNPDFTRQGLGRATTLAGLEWLTNQGLTVGMLYVESDNHPAKSIYHRIGFDHHHTDSVYWRSLTV